MLSNGLNISKKMMKQPVPKIPHKSPVFGEEESDIDTAREIELLHKGIGGISKSSLKKSDIDESAEIYDYDGIYDSMKTGERQALQERELDKKARKPKYMQNLFQMAEIRKKDRQRAEDVKLQRERDAEGDGFADKEKFVTGAYRAQQEEMRKLEEEEATREADLRSKIGGLVSFNQNLLEKGMRKKEAAIQASLNAQRSEALDAASLDYKDAQMERQMIDEAEAKLGYKIALNDDNQIVDHRQLLGAGLNQTKSANHLKSSQISRKSQPSINVVEREARRAQIERQQRVLDQQLQDSRKRQADEMSRQKEAVKDQAKRTKTDSDVLSAKERYLARKKAEVEAKAAAPPH